MPSGRAKLFGMGLLAPCAVDPCKPPPAQALQKQVDFASDMSA
jgi:hypothetical protein